MHRARAADGPLVAIKLLAPSAELDDAAARARIEREIRALGELAHPHLIPLLDSGVDDELGPYLVTPLVTGQSLRALVAGARLCPEGALLLAAPLASALAAMHRAGLVHRDVKPENALAQPDGQLLLCDLGLALGAGDTRYTEEGAVVGSVPYMAPEQVEGRGVGPAVDVWAMGVLIYEWIAGARPFARDRPAEEAAAILVGSFAPLSAADRRVSEALSALVGRCLAADPAARPAMDELAAALAAMIDWTDGDGIAAERAALVADPVGYQERIARFRVARVEREAREAMAAGRAFVALRQIDRGLAYVPDDPALRALSEQAEASEAPAAAPAAAVRSRRGLVFAALAALVLIVGAAVVLAVVGRGDDTQQSGGFSLPSGSQVTVTRSAPTADDQQAMKVVGSFVNLFERGLDVQEEEQRRARLAAANQSAPATGEALAELTPLAPADLANDAPAGDLSSLTATGGAPLVPDGVLGGADADKTMADFDRRVADVPSDVDTAVARAMVYLAAGKTDAGLEMLDQLERTHPESAAVWRTRGFVDLRRGRFDDADRALGRAIELDPDDGQSLRNRGILRNRQGHIRDAYLDLRRALSISPGDVQARRELAAIYRGAGHPADAEALRRR